MSKAEVGDACIHSNILGDRQQRQSSAFEIYQELY